MSELKKIIEQAFEQRDEISFNTKGEIRDSVEETLNQLDVGKIRVCEKINDEWIVNQWIKKAILLSFRLNDNEIVKASHATWYDKVPSKTANWTKDDHEKARHNCDNPGPKTKARYWSCYQWRAGAKVNN